MERIVDKLISCLNKENDLTRCVAARVIGKVGGERVVPALERALLQDPDPDVRMEAASSLGEIASPQATGPLVEALMKDPDGDVRIEACRALGRIRDERAIDALLECIRGGTVLEVDDFAQGDDMEFSATWEIQRMALEMLAGIDRERVIDRVMELLEDEMYEDLQELGFSILAMSGKDRAVGFVLRSLREGGRITKRRAATALGRAVDRKDVVEGLLNALLDEEGDVRIYAARSLARSKDSAVVIPLFLLLKDPSEEVRKEALEVISTLEITPEVCRRLIPLLEDRDRSVRIQAVRVLGREGSGEALDRLIDVLAGSGDDEDLLAETAIALGKIGNPKALEPLSGLLQNPSPEVRYQAVTAMGMILGRGHVLEDHEGAFDPVEALLSAVEDDDDRVSMAALIGLVRTGDERALDRLVEIISGGPEKAPIEEETEGKETQGPQGHVEPEGIPVERGHSSTLAAITAECLADVRLNEEIRRDGSEESGPDRRRLHAIRLSAEVEDDRVKEALIKAAREGDRHVRRESLSALASMGVREAVDVAMERLDSGDRDVRIAAVELLRTTGEDSVLPHLRQLLGREEDPLVSVKILETMGDLGDREAIPLVVARLADRSRQVRAAALDTLGRLGAVEATERIRAAIWEAGGELRREAVRTLKALGDRGLVDSLMEVLDSPEREEDHWIAIECLEEYLCGGRSS